ncbi:MAG TPA: hypothetical protein GXZ43_01350 [Clostridiaceae bacterium]|nr:hypothetical protein [Clostridiaceae bacterium]
MAQDDYFVVVYHICNYLYDCLKQGKEIDIEQIKPINKKFVIKENYWKYIICNLYKDGYIDGITIYNADDETHITNLEDIQITPKGIEYLQENNMMKKIVKGLKTVKEITPLI